MSTFSKFVPQRAIPVHPFFRNTFPSFWDNEFSGHESAAFVPAVNIVENENSWHIEMSAPGFRKEDFSVKLENNLLTISAEHKAEETEEQKNYRRREFRYGSFSRSFRLQKDKVNEESISASYENGILNILVPKKEAAPKPEAKEIKIA